MVAQKANLSFKNKFLYISVIDEASYTSNLACSWGLPCPSFNPTRRKIGCGPGLGELPKIWGFPFHISATAGASDFKFCMPLGFANSHHIITPIGKVGVTVG